MDVAFEKLLYQSTQGYARNNPTKFEVLTPSGSSVTSSMDVVYGNFLHESIQSYSWNSPVKFQVP